ncbi:MAG: hypothetical protein ACRDQA_03710 [Nocardioidaceae bacterium]
MTRTLGWVRGEVGPGLLLAGGFAISGYFQLAAWRHVLIGSHPVHPIAALGLLAVVSLLAWGSLARRQAVWLSPAELTWQDATDHRVQVVRRRLLAAWRWRLAAVAYLWTMAAALTGASLLLWILGSTLGGTAAIGVLLWLGPARTAARAGRPQLVTGWRARVVRSGALQFLDPMLLVGAARPVTLSLVGATVLRYTLVGLAGSGHALVAALLLVFLAIVLLELAPALPASAVLAATGYLSLLPAAGGLARLWRHPSLRRWIDAGDLRLHVTSAAVLIVPVLGWCALAILLGAPPVVLATTPIIVVAVVRTVTRPLPRYDDIGVVDTPKGPMPIRLITQTLRGIDILIIATTILIITLLTGLLPWITALLLAGLCSTALMH